MLRMDRCNIIALFEKLGRFERFAGERQLPYAIGVNFKKFTHIARTVHSCVLCVYQNGTFVCSVRISERYIRVFCAYIRTVHSCVLYVYQNGTFMCSVRISERYIHVFCTYIRTEHSCVLYVYQNRHGLFPCTPFFIIKN